MTLMNSYFLREIHEEDLELVLKWRNSERIRASMYSDHIISFEEHCAWFHKVQKERRTFHYMFCIGSISVGVVNFTRFDTKNGKCHWGFYIGELDTPPGSGSIMGYLALEKIFETHGIRKLIGEILAFNAVSIHFHQKMGFVLEGIFKKDVLKNNQYEDVLSMALFREDWFKKKEQLKQICFQRGDKDA